MMEEDKQNPEVEIEHIMDIHNYLCHEEKDYPCNNCQHCEITESYDIPSMDIYSTILQKMWFDRKAFYFLPQWRIELRSTDAFNSILKLSDEDLAQIIGSIGLEWQATTDILHIMKMLNCFSKPIIFPQYYGDKLFTLKYLEEPESNKLYFIYDRSIYRCIANPIFPHLLSPNVVQLFKRRLQSFLTQLPIPKRIPKSVKMASRNMIADLNQIKDLHKDTLSMLINSLETIIVDGYTYHGQKTTCNDIATFNNIVDKMHNIVSCIEHFIFEFTSQKSVSQSWVLFKGNPLFEVRLIRTIIQFLKVSAPSIPEAQNIATEWLDNRSSNMRTYGLYRKEIRGDKLSFIEFSCLKSQLSTWSPES
jgi:hypothetical protein